MEITVHTKADCPHCTSLKIYLSQNGVLYAEVPHNDAEERARFYDDAGLAGPARTMPQVFVTQDGATARIGGFMATLSSGIVRHYTKLHRAEG